MKYYKIAFPLKLYDCFSYSHTGELIKGQRVLASLKGKELTGIVWGETEAYKGAKPLLAVIDEEPLLDEELQYLADWIANYYKAPLGMVLQAMLPSGIRQEVVTRLQKIKNNGQSKLLSFLPEKLWVDLSSLRKSFPDKNVIRELEILEEQGYIEIERTFDNKVKKKKRNYIYPQPDFLLTALTPKQREAYIYFVGLGREFPMKDIVDKYSYAVIKALKQKEAIRIKAKFETDEDLFATKPLAVENFILNEKQAIIAAKYKSFLRQGGFKTELLFGITGSGKTIIYLDVIKTCLQLGKTALMLVPEISLTPQMVEKFRQSLGAEIAVLHSHLNERQRLNEWRKLRSGQVRVVIGARSAVFAPLKNLGVVIVDEEQEHTYKQESTPRYHGRDLAVVRGQHAKALVIVGSATPALESYYNAQTGKFGLELLTARAKSAILPQVEIIDLRSSRNVISEVLKEEILQRWERNEQTILFQNRRGYASYVQCVTCGTLFTCPHCSIGLSYHKSNHSLHCHYCGYSRELPRTCPHCGSYVYTFGAAGTQQVERQLRVLFPEARIMRMDSDSTGSKDSYEIMFTRMKEGSVDILLGTQMIAKGLDFHKVTLVGVILADVMLNVPDFRAGERTFSLLTQVAGRAGRGDKPGKVIIQTYNPEHYAIKLAQDQNYQKFAELEEKYRQEAKYPPYYKLARLVFSHPDELLLKENMKNMQKLISHLKEKTAGQDVTVLGPVSCPIAKIKDHYRYHIIIKSLTPAMREVAVTFILTNLRLPVSIRVIADIDPAGLM